MAYVALAPLSSASSSTDRRDSDAKALPRSSMHADAIDWPHEALQAFALRMADHGHSISSTFMTFDKRYALEQLRHAHTLADEPLRELAMALFHQFLRRQSGLPHSV